MSMIGKSLIHYEISAQIGRGGMGEVYHAKDTKLKRDVAIKILPEEFALDADRVARFQREGKLLASLNHPNIAAIYGLDESDGTNFLVMELIEGDTLAERIKAGPIPVEEALKLALQIAEALEAAHEKGVIHRDLKPANIKVTPDSKVKVLDFGLAKAFVEDQGEEKPLDSPTMSAATTQKGIILGTAAYMSPEQAKGKSVDKRADIWAFGVVLFEMLTGQRLFTGETASETLAAVMMKDPDFSKLSSNLHTRIRFLLERCLEKNPRNRYSGISDARVDIQEVLADPGGVLMQPVTTAEPQTRSRSIIPWIASILGILIVGTAIWYLKTPEPPEIIRFSYEIPLGQQFSNLYSRCLAVSPDGRNILYSTPDGLFLRSIDELDTRHISGTKNSRDPFFSPDNQWIGFYSIDDKQLKKISINGGAPVVLCEVGEALNASWNSDDTIIYSDLNIGIMRISSNGGTPEVLVEQEPRMLVSPLILPDGKTLMFNHYKPNGEIDIIVQSLESGERKVLFPGANPIYLPTGHIVYGLKDSLFAVPFEVDTLDVVGSPVSIVQGIYRGGPNSVLHYAVSDTGTLIYIPGTIGISLVDRTLVWVDRQGKEEQLVAEPGEYRFFKISPDGTRAALTLSKDLNTDIYIWDFIRETIMRLTRDKADDGFPIWSPDGKDVLFSSNRGGHFGVYRKAADGAGEVELVGSQSDGLSVPSSWSDDGKNILVSEFNRNSRGDIGILSLEEERDIKLILHGNYQEADPQISPDGRWMAYVSDESGVLEVYVRPFPEINKERCLVSRGFGLNPQWSSDGRELLYWSEDALMRVPVNIDATFKAGIPEVLLPKKPYYTFDYTGDFSVGAIAWDMDPDGKRFLVIKPPVTTAEETKWEKPEAAGPRQINIVLNWFEELKEKVPVD